MQSFDKIAAVVVTHNRLELLKECLSGIRIQERLPDVIFVINNGSTDGTELFLSVETGLKVIHQQNTGGAGGFFTGIQAAYEWGADAIWCMDDDTIPVVGTLSGLVSSAKAHVCSVGVKPLGWVCSVVRWVDGRIHVMNRPELVDGCDWLINCGETKALPAISCSYVSVLITRDAIGRAGYPIAEMYIWGDDVEHTRRITNAGFCGLVSFASPCLHKTALNLSTNLSHLTRENLGKYRFHFRNSLYLARHGSGGAISVGVSFARQWSKLFFALIRKRKIFAVGLFFKSSINAVAFNPPVRKP